MAFDPVTAGIEVGGSLLSGFLANRMSPEQRRLLKINSGVAQNLYNYGTSAPGASQQDQQGLAQQLALLGEQQAGQQQQATAALNLQGQGGAGLGDFLRNLQGQQAAQRMAVSSQAMLDAMQQRRQSLLQAAGVAQGGQNLTQTQPSQFGQAFGQLANQMAYSRAYNQQNKQQQPNLPGGYWTQATGGGQPLPNGSGALTPSYWSQPAQGGMVAPGNEPGGINGLANQIRQPVFGQLRLPNGEVLG